jgi:hypothetical protein
LGHALSKRNTFSIIYYSTSSAFPTQQPCPILLTITCVHHQLTQMAPQIITCDLDSTDEDNSTEGFISKTAMLGIKKLVPTSVSSIPTLIITDAPPMVGD